MQTRRRHQVEVSNLDFVCNPSPYSLLRRANSHGFAALPDELFLEILSYLPATPVIPHPPKRDVLRRETLLSLSAVCQNLRRIFRPCLWQRVEVYSGMRVGGQVLNHIAMSGYGEGRRPKKDFARELLRQLNVVTIQDPGLAQYVRMVDIEINGATFRPIFVELARCFSLFPNLHTVKIVTELPNIVGETAMKAATRYFKKKIPYPQIRSAILSSSIYPLLAVCPNLESLATFEGYTTPCLLKSIKALPGLQKLSCPLSLANAKEVAKGRSSLEQIMISLIDRSSSEDKNYTTQLMKTIRLFPNLRILVLHLPSYFCHCTTCASTELLKEAFLNLEPHDCQNLKEVIFSTNSYEIVLLSRSEI